MTYSTSWEMCLLSQSGEHSEASQAQVVVVSPAPDEQTASVSHVGGRALLSQTLQLRQEPVPLRGCLCGCG